MNNQIAINVSGAHGLVPYTYKTVVLKPNVVDGKNILTQLMMGQTNTKYVIKYDYVIDPDIQTGIASVSESNISHCVNPNYAAALAAYNLAHDAWIDADNAYTNNPNDTTLAAKNAAYATYTAAQTTLNNTPQFYYYAANAILVKQGQYISIPKGCVLLNASLSGITDFVVAPADTTVYIGSLTAGEYNYTVQNAIVIPSGCLIEFDGGSISNGVLVGDETILIFDQEEEVVLKNVELLGDFEYSAGGSGGVDKKDNVDGMATITLKKNKNFASQLTQPNTIYRIVYDFDLGNEIVTVPENCVLEFDGGHIYNGHFNGNFDNDEYNITNFMRPNTTDITDALNMLVEMQKTAHRKTSADGKYYCKQCTIYIPGGLWECGEIEISYTFYATIIKGELNFFPPESTVSGTIIQPRSSNQTYIWKLGCVERWTFNIVIENITFSDFGATKCNLTEGALSLVGCATCWFKGLQFRYMNGCCIKISSSWELDFDTINLREIGGISLPKIWFAGTIPLTWNKYPNISQCNIGTIYFESCDGTIVRSDPGSSLDNVTIDNLIGENSCYSTESKIADISDEDYAAATSIPFIDIQCAYRFTIANINCMQARLYCTRIDGILYKYDIVVMFGNTRTNLQIGNLTTSLHQATPTRKIDIIHGTGGYLQITNIFLNNSVDAAEFTNLTKLFRLYCNKVYGLSIGSIMANSVNGVVNFSPMLEMYNAYKYTNPQRLNNNGTIMYDEAIPGLHLGVLQTAPVIGASIRFVKNPFAVYAVDVIAQTGGVFNQYVLHGLDNSSTINQLCNSNGGYLCATKDGQDYYYDQVVYESATADIDTGIYFTGIEGAVYIVAVHEVFASVPKRTIQNSIGFVDDRLTYVNTPWVKKSPVLLRNTEGTPSERPTGLGASHIGAQYFENANGVSKPIYWTNDTSDGKSGWVDATGTPV